MAWYLYVNNFSNKHAVFLSGNECTVGVWEFFFDGKDSKLRILSIKAALTLELVLWAQSTTKDYVMAALTENTVDRQTQTNRDQEDERNRESSCRRKLDTTNAYFLASLQSLPVDWLLQLRMFHHLIQVTSGTNVPSDILIDLAVHKPSTNALFTRHYKILSSGMVVVKKTGKWKK